MSTTGAHAAPHVVPSVELVHWPREAARRAELGERSVPRMLLVAEGTPPPEVDELEDWLRVPADERDLVLRAERLCHLTTTSVVTTADTPLSVPAQELPILLSPAQSSLVSRLSQDYERIVTRADLELAVWGAARASSCAIASLIARCRRSLAPFGLTIAAVRGRGYTLARTDDDA
jgi:DNA-binding response OmpR family regulator